jgi:tripartite-type tricarboxylate transporter receptor subunit TctC
MRNRWIAGGAAIAIVIAGVGVSAASRAQQHAYPAKPIRAVVAFAPGGVADTVARIIGARLADRLGQPVVVENRPGAAGTIAARAVAAAPADGYTLLVSTAALAVTSNMPDFIGFDPLTELVPIAVPASTPTIFVVPANAQASTLREFVALGKGKRLSYSSAGVGTTTHLTAEYLLKSLAGLDAVHIPFKGGAPAVTAVVSGEIELASTSAPTAGPYIRQGRLKPIAVASRARLRGFPHVPTMIESGFEDYEDSSWIGYFAPGRTTVEIIERLNREINEILSQPEIRDRLVDVGFELQSLVPRETAEYFRAETAKWGRIIKATGVSAASFGQ